VKPPEAFDAFLVRSGLAGPNDVALWRPLAGGVSSDVWMAELPGRAVVVKQALAQLRVAADWRAPVGRNANEYAWIEEARRRCPEAVPEPLAHDPAEGIFAMAYLAPPAFRNWRDELTDGTVDPKAGREVGRRLALLHAGTAGRPDVRARFDDTDLFRQLRLEPYLLAAADKNPDLADILGDIEAETEQTRTALVHGDVSPKNILLGPNGPVFIDAECAWYGDPAFDLAFCLSHLMLGALDRPPTLQARLQSGADLAKAYLEGVNWEPADALDARAARLLPALMLARVDGKSTLDYLASEDRQDLVRGFARSLLLAPAAGLAQAAKAWALAAAG
jgi:5-methylthioribose kinase